ncbi:MAG: DEAD/DEAH box helicase [Deltaproteobacteria bacterium]|nr:DEAD/DEAH box helicase [Deltaproteobacteria bacterium]
MSTKSSTSASAGSDRRAALDAGVDTLTSASTARSLRAAGVRTVFDLLCTMPRAVIDLRAPLVGPAIVAHARAAKGLVAVRGVVERVSVVPMRGRRAIRVALRSEGVLVELWWFFMYAAARTLSGEIVAAAVPALDPRRPSVVRMIQPRIWPRISPTGQGGLEPVYAVAGVSSARVAEAARAAVAALAPNGAHDDLDPTGVHDVVPLLRAVHAPDDLEAHEAAREALRRKLAWAEAAWLVLRRVERERALAGTRAPRLPRDPETERALIDALGFPLTGAQRRAIAEIAARLDEERPSRTLLTGDVGTGKTAVLLAAAAQAVAAGTQVAVLAPTTVLADQYRAALAVLSKAIDARVATVSEERTEKTLARRFSRRFARRFSSIEAQVVVGTHALLGERVQFERLGLVVVDEQHRLGVGQRLALVGKGGALSPHLLSVSATPIPRTLALALRGEIANVHLDERPSGRETPATRALPRSAWDEVRSVIDAAVSTGDRVFLVCARIQERDGEEGGTPGAEARAAELRKAPGLGKAVALAHGGLDDDEIRAAVQAFRDGDARVLVGTSMLEVGLDVPEATLMVIDGADRLGLAQLHQLRGRVGRGARPGTCLLVHDDPPSDVARARLDALIAARDGMEVARADLALRGPGDLDGARQAGEAAGLRWLDPLTDDALARDASEAVLAGRLPERPALSRVLARLDALSQLRATARDEAG